MVFEQKVASIGESNWNYFRFFHAQKRLRKKGQIANEIIKIRLKLKYVRSSVKVW